jgi:dolichol kinase
LLKVGFKLSTLEFYSAAVLLRTAPKPLIDETLAMTELDLLKKPEYIHVVLNHLPIYGTIFGALALAISLILRSRAAQITALILTFIAGTSAYPVFVTGQRAYKTIRNASDDAGADWLDDHMDRAEKTIGVFYFLAALAIAGLLVPIKWPKSAFPLAALTLVVAILCSGIAVYIAQPGGRVRHPEFRPSETRIPGSETDHHDKK